MHSFKKVWSTIDTDNSGYIEANELRTFLEKCLELKTSKEVPISQDALDDYTNSIVSKIMLLPQARIEYDYSLSMVLIG